MTPGESFLFQLTKAELDRLLPMHILIDAGGFILDVGPTLGALRPDAPLVGTRFLDRFDLRRPHGVASAADLAGQSGRRLNLIFADTPHTSFKGHALGLAGGVILADLSFGITVVDAVSQYGLTVTDFAPTDLAIEMLYLVEAKSAAMEASRKLNLRLQHAKSEAEEKAVTDALTGVRNRRGMEAMLQDLIARGVGFGLLHVDLDYFKAVNDSLGHAAGDHVLTEVARLLRSQTRDLDCVIRFGGDEFVVVFRHMTDPASLHGVAMRIIGLLERPMVFAGRECRVSASIGVTSTALYDRPDSVSMLRDADAALYSSKAAGRATATVAGFEARTGN